MNKKVLYPGTFDPITNGHMDIIVRAKKIFDEVVVAVAVSKEKRPMFSLEKRVAMIKEATKNMEGVSVKPFDSLMVDFAKELNIYTVIRGLRAVSDFEYELQMGYANASLNPQIETIYLMPNLKNAFVSSSVVRTILKFGGDPSHLVPKEISPLLKA